MSEYNTWFIKSKQKFYIFCCTVKTTKARGIGAFDFVHTYKIQPLVYNNEYLYLTFLLGAYIIQLINE